MAPSRRPSDDAGDEGGISDWVSLNKQVTDPKSHTLVRISFTAFFQILLPAKFHGRHYFGLAIHGGSYDEVARL